MVGEAADREFLKMPMFFGMALLIIMAVQYWSFRSLQGMLLPLLTGILSVIWSLGLMGLLNVHLDPLNTTTPILVLAVASGHAIQILKRYYEEYSRLIANGATPHDANRAAVVESIVRVGPVMMVAGLIAVLTFFSLVTTGIPMVQHFGIFAGCGVLATMIIEMTVIPAVRTMLRPPKKHESKREGQAGVLDRFLTGVADALVGGRARAGRRRRARPPRLRRRGRLLPPHRQQLQALSPGRTAKCACTTRCSTRRSAARTRCSS